MGHILIKPDRDIDYYVEWSTIVEGPIEDGKAKDFSPSRVARCDKFGTSALDFPFGSWDDEYLIFEQRGMLKRSDLAKACELMGESGNDRPAELLALLKPFED